MEELIVKDGKIRLSEKMLQKVKANFSDPIKITVMQVLEYLSTAKK